MALRGWIEWGAVLGFALGGFFDGILLHQILQWHHLLSLVPGVDTLRGQVLWDGYFHALMYGVAAAGLWGLWRVRGQAGARSGRRLVAALHLGFGLWHVVDSVLSHWLLGIHRIRIDSPDPLMWDLIWFAAFGLLPLLLGWWLLRMQRGDGGGPGASMIVIAVGLITAGLGAWSLKPSADQRFTTIVFAPWVSPAEAANALRAHDGRLVWTDPSLAVVIAEVPRERRLRLYSNGALLVSGTAFPNGCFGWSKA